MRLRFTIRDLLWLTLVVALATAWWFDHARLTADEFAGVEYGVRPIYFNRQKLNLPDPVQPIANGVPAAPGS